jgi:hypothetical protein
MNIKNRLKRIEAEIIKDDSEFCECDRGVNIRLPGDPPFPEKCEICDKPLFFRVVTFDFYSNARLTGEV